MIQDEKCSKIYLQKPTHGCGLATLTKAVLGLSLDKTEQQIVVLLKDEIEKRLKQKIDENATIELMETAYDSHQRKWRVIMVKRR